MADDARDAQKYRLLLRWLRNGRIPGPAYGRPFKLIETCPTFGEEREVPNIDRDLELAIGVAMGTQAYCGRCDRGPAQAPSCPHGEHCGRPAGVDLPDGGQHG